MYGRLSVIAVLLLGLAGRADAQNKGLEGPVLKERTQEIKKKIGDNLAALEALYKQIHANPELSLAEVQTAARLAKELKELGFTAENVAAHAKTLLGK